MTKPKRVAEKPSLEQRIESLQAEIAALVAEYVDQRAAACPGVPRGVVEQTMFARARGCRCEELKLLQKGP